jgi:hypothetical protein
MMATIDWPAAALLEGRECLFDQFLHSLRSLLIELKYLRRTFGFVPADWVRLDRKIPRLLSGEDVVAAFDLVVWPSGSSGDGIDVSNKGHRSCSILGGILIHRGLFWLHGRQAADRLIERQGDVDWWLILLWRLLLHTLLHDAIF